MTARFHPFALERLLSQWENRVTYNLSESGVQPATLRELVADAAAVQDLLGTTLTYPQTNGLPLLRERISALYPGSTPEQIVVTNGCAEANFNALQTVAGPGDEIAFMRPNYMQLWGVARNAGMKVQAYTLDDARDWAVDPGSLEAAVGPRTRLIAVCNPNNPTGHILTEREMDQIVTAAERVGAWILADEVYAGAERLRPEVTPSFWGRYSRVLATGGLSKAYGLPGLRIGWVAAPADTAAEIWARQDYTTISSSMLGNKLAAIALAPEVRPRLLARTREYVARGYGHLAEWVARHQERLSLGSAEAGAIGFVRYDLPVGAIELAERLLADQDVLVVPGDYFGVDRHLRLNHGLPPAYVTAGLDRIWDGMAALA